MIKPANEIRQIAVEAFINKTIEQEAYNGGFFVMINAKMVATYLIEKLKLKGYSVEEKGLTEYKISW